MQGFGHGDTVGPVLGIFPYLNPDFTVLARKLFLVHSNFNAV